MPFHIESGRPKAFGLDFDRISYSEYAPECATMVQDFKRHGERTSDYARRRYKDFAVAFTIPYFDTVHEIERLTLTSEDVIITGDVERPTDDWDISLPPASPRLHGDRQDIHASAQTG